MTGLEALENIGNIDLGDNPYKTFEHNKLKNVYSVDFNLAFKSLKAFEIIKKLFNPEKYNFLELYENPFITIGEKGEKYRIDSTDDSYIHVGIPKEEFELLKEALE